jgi:hypothetical protein
LALSAREPGIAILFVSKQQKRGEILAQKKQQPLKEYGEDERDCDYSQ